MPDWMLDFSMFGMPFHFWTGVYFIFGSMVGSFLNVCIHRMPRGESLWSPPSHCPHCGARIPMSRNIPLLTWLLQRGRCAQCRGPISPRYFFVELITGIAFTACWIAFGRIDPAAATALCPFLAILIASSAIDLEHYIIPDELTLGGTFLGLIASALAPGLHATLSAGPAMKASAIGLVTGAAVVFGVLTLGKWLFGRYRIPVDPAQPILFHETGIAFPDHNLPFEEVFSRPSDAIRIHAQRLELPDRCYANIRLHLSPRQLRIGDEILDPESVPHMEVYCEELSLPREAMGLGDVKFMACIGAFLGWKATLFSLTMSAVLGVVVSVLLYVIRRGVWNSKLPYGPYIAAAAVLWVFGGQRLWNWMFP